MDMKIILNQFFPKLFTHLIKQFWKVPGPGSGPGTGSWPGSVAAVPRRGAAALSGPGPDPGPDSGLKYKYTLR